MDKKDIRILKDGSNSIHEIKPLPTDRYDDEFGEIAKEIQNEWDYSGLSGTVYEKFARECFNRYLRKL